MKNIFKKMLSFIPQPLRNKYVLTGGLFLVWILLFDPVNVIDWVQEGAKLRRLQQEKRRLEYEIGAANSKVESFNNPDSLEKTAREQFYFVGPHEEVFIIEEE
jgi:cell division protein FtsB